MYPYRRTMYPDLAHPGSGGFRPTCPAPTATAPSSWFGSLALDSIGLPAMSIGPLAASLDGHLNGPHTPSSAAVLPVRSTPTRATTTTSASRLRLNDIIKAVTSGGRVTPTLSSASAPAPPAPARAPAPAPAPAPASAPAPAPCLWGTTACSGPSPSMVAALKEWVEETSDTGATRRPAPPPAPPSVPTAVAAAAAAAATAAAKEAAATAAAKEAAAVAEKRATMAEAEAMMRSARAAEKMELGKIMCSFEEAKVVLEAAKVVFAEAKASRERRTKEARKNSLYGVMRGHVYATKRGVYMRPRRPTSENKEAMSRERALKMFHDLEDVSPEMFDKCCDNAGIRIIPDA